MNEHAVRIALKVAEVTRERDEARAELAHIITIAEDAHRTGVHVDPALILNRRDYGVQA